MNKIDEKRLSDLNQEFLDGHIFSVLDERVISILLKARKEAEAPDNHKIEFKLCHPVKILDADESLEIIKKVKENTNLDLNEKQCVIYFEHFKFNVGFTKDTSDIDKLLNDTIKDITLDFTDKPSIFSQYWLINEYKKILEKSMPDTPPKETTQFKI